MRRSIFGERISTIAYGISGEEKKTYLVVVGSKVCHKDTFNDFDVVPVSRHGGNEDCVLLVRVGGKLVTR